MRKIREVLQLLWECGLSQRQVTGCCGLGKTTVVECASRARKAGLNWSVAADLTDEERWPQQFPRGRVGKAGAGVVVRTLGHLPRSLRHLTDLGRLVVAQDVGPIATCADLRPGLPLALKLAQELEHPPHAQLDLDLTGAAQRVLWRH